MNRVSDHPPRQAPRGTSPRLGFALMLLLLAPILGMSAALAQDRPPVLGAASGDSTARPPTLPIPSDSSEVDSARSLAAWSRTIPVGIWSPIEPSGFAVRLSDSLLRWQPVTTWTESLDDVGIGIRSYGFGISGRTDALYAMADDPWHLRLTLEGLDLNDPITGQPDLNRISRRRVSSMSLGRGLTSAASLTAYDRVHHLTEPRMYLHFSESGSSLRNLDILYTHNVLRNWNMEIGYHDQRDGLDYSGMKVEGGELYFRSWMQVSEAVRLRMGWQSKSLETEEPFGYTAGDLSLFTFDPLTARPLVSGLRGTRETSDRFIQLESRPADATPSSLTIGVHDQSTRRRLPLPGDPVEAEVRRVELMARHVREGRSWVARSEVRLRSERLGGLSFDGRSNRIAMVSSTFGSAPQAPLDLVAGGSVTLSQDGAHSHFIHASASLDLGDLAVVTADVSRHSLAPSYQMRHWTSTGYLGVAGLDPEVSLRSGIGMRLLLRPGWTIASRIAWRRSNSTPWMDPEGVASSSDTYEVLSGHVSAGVNADHLEAALDAQIRHHMGIDPLSADPYVLRLERTGPQLLIRGSAFLKGPVFQQAAFVTSGLVVRLSPLVAQGPSYDPVLDRWEMARDVRELPAWLALDARFSARLRWMMLHLELENMLDGLGQAGYFVTPGYPMPGRRWVFGLQVLFRN